MQNIVQMIIAFVGGYIASSEGISTLLILLVMFLKLLINRNATVIDFKRMVYSMPSELTFLVLGFLMSRLIENNEGELLRIIAIIVITLLVLVLEYALERWLEDKIAGELKISTILCIVFMYVITGILYLYVVFGGLS